MEIAKFVTFFLVTYFNKRRQIFPASLENNNVVDTGKLVVYTRLIQRRGDCPRELGREGRRHAKILVGKIHLRASLNTQMQSWI